MRRIATWIVILIILLPGILLPIVLVDSTEAILDETIVLETVAIIPTSTSQIIETEPIETIPEPTPEELLWEQRWEEYPVATRMWIYMHENFGWSNEVCAGVIGNVMAETGASTLDIPLKEYKKGPFGLFQWTKQRHKDVVARYGYDATIEEQLDFVYDELYGANGVKQQVKDWQREEILAAKSAKRAAYLFCEWFERPNGKGTIRQKYAKIAYEYFTSEGV